LIESLSFVADANRLAVRVANKNNNKNQSGFGRSEAEQAADRKKYEGLPDSFVFQPIAIETMGRYNSSHWVSLVR